MRPGLERIEALLDAIGRPEQAFTIAQVGGTNGKGSISAMLAAILQASGRRVGLYTSPHLRHYRERIRVDGRPISEADFVDGVDALGTLIARLDVTVFEAGTALALDHFCRARVDVAVLEVGLGGRLDATTVGRPAVVVARAHRLRPPARAGRHPDRHRGREGGDHPERGGLLGPAGPGGGPGPRGARGPGRACRSRAKATSCT